MNRFNILFVILTAFTLPLNAAYLKNIPKTIVQPDGTIIECFVSGDEFHNWIHDENNYTIIQSQNGYYYYADKIGNMIVPSQYIVGKTMIKSTSIQPGINISPEQWKQKRRNKLFMDPLKSYRTKEMTDELNINQLCIYIRFNDDSEWTKDTSSYYNWSNDELPTSISMFNFFNTVSYNKVEIRSQFYPKSSTSTVVSYQDINPRGYFEPYNETTNPVGYDPNESDLENENNFAKREWDLLGRAIDYFNNNYTVPNNIDLDWDDDGLIDNIVFFTKGETGEWGDLLWPHNWTLHKREKYIGDLRVYNYNFQIESIIDQIGVSVLCHEMAHAIGFKDLYHYSETNLDPVGIWDIMGAVNNNPQSFSAYTKFKYGGWLSSIPEITTANIYELNPIDSVSNNCFKIASPYSTSEFFVLEYRKNTGLFDASLPGSGLLVYKINTKAGKGNSGGPPDEVYVYRPGGSKTNNGNLDQAFFSLSSGRVSIDITTDPYPFLNDEGFGGLYISEISDANEKISFRVDFHPDVLYPDFTPTTKVFGFPVMFHMLFDDISRGEPDTWEWTFEGGTPSTFTGKNPPPIQYQSTGTFDVTLQVTKGAETLTETREDFVTVIVNPNALPAKNLTAEIVPYHPNDVELNWSPPSINPSIITHIHWDKSVLDANTIEFGLDTTEFEIFSIWEPSDLLLYDDWYITNINFFANTSVEYPTNKNNYTLLIGEEVFDGSIFIKSQQDIPEFNIGLNKMNYIELQFPYKIDASKKLYFGVRYKNFDNANDEKRHPFGIDEGPAVEGEKGGFFRVRADGNLTSGNLSDYNISGNWNLSATIANLENAPPSGYYIYRNGEIILSPTGMIKDTTYTDLDLADGNYEYFVVTNYEIIGSSIASNIVSIDVITPDLPQKEKHDIIIYPNPVINKNFYFKIKESTTGPILINIYNQLGNVVYTNEIFSPSEINNISVETLPIGIYNIVVYSDSETYKGKFIIIK